MKMKNVVSLLLAGVITLSCVFSSATIISATEKNNHEIVENNFKKRDLVQYVNPLIGTNNFKGNSEWAGTAPLVSTPFGMTNFTPQTRLNRIGDISYMYRDTEFKGFMATHQPAIWMGDYGYVNVAPQIGNIRPDENGRALTFSHDDEISTPYYYKVTAGKNEGKPITAEVTATERCAVYNFTYPESNEAKIFVESARNSGNGKITVDVEKGEIYGWNNDNMSSHLNNKPPKNLKGYFVIQFSKSLNSKGTYENYNLTEDKTTAEGQQSGAYLSFTTEANEIVEVKIGTSFHSVEQARANIDQEIGDKTFNEVKEEAKNTWNDKLNAIQIEGATDAENKIFYTAMYHALLYPRSFYENVNGKDMYFSPYDDQYHEGRSYTDFSLWDTFRAQNSFITLVAPERVSDMINSLLQTYKEGGYMPKWPNPGYTNIMIGTHADSVVAEAINKGFDGFDYNLAYEAVLKDAMVPQEKDGEIKWADRQTNVPYEARGGLSVYKYLGYIPNGYVNENVSRTIEFSYDDWCVAQVAKAVGKEDEAKYFLNRSMNYKNTISPDTGYAMGRDIYGNWSTNGEQFTEGDRRKYTWFAPHDPQGLLNLMAKYKGADFYNTELEKAFGGLGGNKWIEHQNEPCHNYAYMFDFSGRPDLTQKYVRQTLLESYTDDTNGELGNDDCGQMSSWYVFSAMGFYPVNPASGEYMIGSPIFDKVTINNPTNGTQFVIEATNNNDIENKNCYIAEATLNGEALDVPYITYDQITNGGNIRFNMSDQPSDWAKNYRKDAIVYDEAAHSPEDNPEPPFFGNATAKIVENNIALTAKAEATTYQNVSDGGSADTLNDGKYDIGYVSANNPTFPQYLTYMWDSPQTFDKLMMYANYPKSQGVSKFVLEATENGETWEPITEEILIDWQSDNSLVQKRIDINPVSNKIGLRMKVLAANNSWGHFAMRELEVYSSNDYVYLKNVQDIKIQTESMRNVFEGIKCNGIELVLDKDYVVDDKIIILKADFLKTLKKDTVAKIELLYNQGENPIIDLPVRDYLNIAIPNEEFTVICDNQNQLTGSEGPIELAFDKNPSTFWHSNYSPKQELPATIDIDMSKAYLINQFTYLPRPGGGNGNITSYDLYGKLNADDEYKLLSSGTWADNGNSKNINFEPENLRYLKFVAKEGRGGFASAAEFTIYQVITEVDKTALQIAVDTANTLKDQGALDNVVPAVAAEFEAALQEAKDILADTTADQTTVDSAFYRLANAIHMLGFIKGDKTALEALIEEAEKYAEENYTTDSWTQFQEALNTAKEVMNDENALEKDVEDAYNSLKDAMANLVLRADKTRLQSLYDMVDGLDKSLYTETSLAGLTDPVAKAKTVLANADVTQKEVDDAYEALIRAYVDLRLIPNKDLLQELINKAQTLNAANYTAKTWNAMVEALEEAKVTLGNENADDAAVKAAIEGLQAGIDNLVVNTFSPVASGDTSVVISGGKTGSIKTGDETSLGMLMSLAGLSLLGIVYSKKKRENI